MSVLDVFRSKRVERRSSMSFQDYVDQIIFQGQSYGLFDQGLGIYSTYGKEKADPIYDTLISFSEAGLKRSAPVFAVERVRLAVFSEARLQWQRLRSGRPGDLFGDQALAILEHPWPGGTTADLLARMLIDADMAGNAYNVRIGDEIIRLRPDWVEILLADRINPLTGEAVGYERVGYFYWHGGKGAAKRPELFLPDEVSHFAPNLDPLANYAGMSWLTPVIREIQADKLATKHKLKFFENAATPNVAVSLAKEVSPTQFREFMEMMDARHKGVENAYRTLYTGGGADVTVIGANMQQLDFKSTQGAGETRIAMAGGIHAVVAGMSEGMQGSSLNAGNFSAARRLVADVTFRPLWRQMVGALAQLVVEPADARLWFDERDIGFLREDRKDQAEIQGLESRSIRTLLDAGYDADSVTRAVLNQDWSLLRHTGLFSVQLQPPGTTTDNPDAPTPNEGEDDNDDAEE